MRSARAARSCSTGRTSPERPTAGPPPHVPELRLASAADRRLHEHVLNSLLDFLLGGSVLWGVYVWQGRTKMGVLGFLCWFPLLLGGTVGSALLLHRITGPVAVPVPPTMYLYPVALLISLLTQPVFRSYAKYVVAHTVMALAVLADFSSGSCGWSCSRCSCNTEPLVAG